MGNKRKWYLILLLGLSLLLISSLIGCGGSSKDTDLQNYLTQVEPLIEEIGDIQSDLINTVEDVGPFGSEDITQELVTANEKYDDLLSRLEAIEYPKEAVKLREQTLDYIGYCKQILDEFVAYVTTQDTSHIDRAESYITDAEELRLLAMDEWDRLTDIAGEGDGIPSIFLGILGFGVVAIIAIFVLELTLGVGFGILAGIVAGIGAIVQKIKGVDRESDENP